MLFIFYFCPVISIWAVFALEMFCDKIFVHGQLGIDAVRDIRHLGHLFHYDCVVDSSCRILTPCEWTVISH